MPEQSWLYSAKEKASSIIGSVTSTAEGAYKTSKEYLVKAAGKVTSAGQTVDEKSDGWLGNNIGLIGGVIGALFAVFGMQGGSIWQPLLAVGALILGALYDKDTNGSLSNGIFGKKKEETPSTEPGRQRQKDTSPTPPSAEAAPPTPHKEPSTIADPKLDTSQKSNSFALSASRSPVYISEQGEVIFNPPKMPNLMKIVVDKEGKALEVAVADGNGDFVKDRKNGNILNNKVSENIQFKSNPGDKGVLHVYVTNAENQAKLIKLREIGTEALLKSKGTSSLELGDRMDTGYLGTFTSPITSASAKKDQSPTVG